MARSKKPKLVTQYLESISSEGFEKHADIIRKFVRGRNGVYALYRKGKLYGSPSAAASAIGKRAINGWSFWHYERGPGDWVPIDELRNV
jgi:hypothetical protein